MYSKYINRTLNLTTITISQYLFYQIIAKIGINRITKFLNGGNFINSLQFGFRQSYSTSHTLINLTEDIRKNLDKGKAGFAIFVDLQSVLDTFDHNIFLANL